MYWNEQMKPHSVFVQCVVSQQYHTWYLVVIPENCTLLQDNACSLNLRAWRSVVLYIQCHNHSVMAAL